MNEIPSFATIELELEGIVLSEKRHKQKRTNIAFSYVYVGANKKLNT